MAESFTRPRKPIPSPEFGGRERLAPLEIAPSMLPLDLSLFPPLRLAALDSCTTHDVSLHWTPAAYPRCISTPGQVVVPQNLSGKERKKWLYATAEQLVKEKRAVEDGLTKFKGKVEEREDRVFKKVGLWNSVFRVKRRKVEGERLDPNVKSITVVATHPVGLHKETYEVLFRHLIDLTEQPGSLIRFEELWSLESVDHGDSSLVNGSNVPKIGDCSDYARDLANFCLNYLPQPSTSQVPPALERVSPSVSQTRKNDGFLGEGRILISLGHSLGSVAGVLCAISYPRIFSALIQSETTFFPRVIKPKIEAAGGAVPFIMSALGRKAVWPSREEAKANLAKSPLFLSFHPSVFQSYIDHALWEDKANNCVRLKCTPVGEARKWNELLCLNEGWQLLPTLDEKIPLYWIMGSTENASFIVGGSEVARDTVWRRPKNTSNIKLPGAGHLLIQEMPDTYAKAMLDYLNKLYVEQEHHKAKL